jgi:hypothetical protein
VIIASLARLAPRRLSVHPLRTKLPHHRSYASSSSPHWRPASRHLSISATRSWRRLYVGGSGCLLCSAKESPEGGVYVGKLGNYRSKVTKAAYLAQRDVGRNPIKSAHNAIKYGPTLGKNLVASIIFIILVQCVQGSEKTSKINDRVRTITGQCK